MKGGNEGIVKLPASTAARSIFLLNSKLLRKMLRHREEKSRRSFLRGWRINVMARRVRIIISSDRIYVRLRKM